MTHASSPYYTTTSTSQGAKQGGLGVPSDKITVIHLGVRIPDVLIKRETSDHIVDAPEIPGTRGATARLLRRWRPHKRGEGAAGGRGVSHRVEFVQADEETLRRLYQTAVALLSIALRGIRAAATGSDGRGVPVVAAKAASIPEVVGDAALLFDLIASTNLLMPSGACTTRQPARS
ncbi:hypothetical protein [Streptomyces himalayensis]|uniref:Uncharacterized protein n=1 Tax=Streptomyces himalayensis subsp. himalayensis TaxID=2756131 RepID=A0A7W0DI37_9ACTN|nr:hypothetical protein [Streptomyces himalayensis]MBA2945195.1 hypothetical protein [Streptomyces himalayensis subsp. himalayensis]